nr:hypothetical protein [uncultured Dyadobacter sp.]
MKNLTHNKKLPKGFKVNPELDGRYHNDPAVIRKMEAVRNLLRIAGLPEVR